MPNIHMLLSIKAQINTECLLDWCIEKKVRITVFPLRVCELSISLIFRACLLFWVLCKGNYYLFTRFKIKKYNLPMLLITASGIILNILWIYVFAWERQVVLRLKPLGEKKKKYWLGDITYLKIILWNVRKEKKHTHQLK